MAEDLSLVRDLHRPNARLGPGSDAHTRLALELAGLGDRPDLKLADLGCGTGASTLVLAESLDPSAEITAVDLVPEFLAELARRAEARGLGGRITTLAASIDALPFSPGSLDAIWSEGAIYNLGFEAGVAAWRPLLATGGILAASELTWLTHARPPALEDYWTAEYPEIATAAAKLAVLERHGFSPIGYFTLPESCWTEHYYGPLRARFPALLAEHGHSDAALALIAAEDREIAVYEQYRGYYSYGFYIARKLPD